MQITVFCVVKKIIYFNLNRMHKKVFLFLVMLINAFALYPKTIYIPSSGDNSNGSSSNLIFDAFGVQNLPKPVVSGSNVNTGWSTYKNNILISGNISKSSNLFVNGKLMLVARWPNSGWINIDSITELNGSLTLTCSKLAAHSAVAYNYWKVATMRWRRWSWWFETPTITASFSPDKLKIPGSVAEDSADGWKFYIDNTFEELYTIGE